MSNSSLDYLMYAVTPSDCTDRKLFLQQIEQVLQAKVSCLQLRLKHLDEPQMIAVAKQVKQLCDQYQTPLIINDSINVAAAVDAAGVHLGQTDTDIKIAKQLLSNDKVIGISVYNLNQALLAQAQGASYLGVGAIFSTSSKSDAQRVDLQTLTAIATNVKIPVVAIGGIDLTNITQLASTGISGVAVINAIFNHPDICWQTQKFKQAVETILRRTSWSKKY